MLQRLILLLVIVVVPGSLFAQALKGRVTDTGGSSLPGAYIIHLVSEHHAHTNEEGYFVLAGVNLGDTVQVSYIGYETKLVRVESLSDDILVRLNETALELSGLVFSDDVDPVVTLASIDLKINPVNTSQEILRRVPGLFIGQHAGGGKAEQIFLRGFDIDHGTDINITVDGAPVNMVSHAHGQGYSDLHWLIPETIERVDFNKGPYNADKGNFATAGYVNYQTKKVLDKNSITVQGGSFNTIRTVGLFNLLNDDRQNAYFASEYLYSDGPFESSQNFYRLNLMGRYNVKLRNGGDMSITASHFSSQWDASGQIPDRAVASGQITRFGALDDTEGGYTNRTNLYLNHTKIVNDNLFVRSNAYYSLYNFELYSNFTFFLEDSLNGDQIRQKENRRLFGAESQLNYFKSISGAEYNLQFGVGLRSDVVRDNELSKTMNRDSTQYTTQLGDVTESNYYTYLNFDLYLGKLRINPGLRADFFTYLYHDKLSPAYDPKSLSKPVISPKLNFIYTLSENTQLFLKSGIGFHTNDTRVVLERDNNQDIIPQAYGVDLGGNFKPFPRLILNTALWYLFLEQEFVYVGDAGIVEPSGKSERKGFDCGFRYQVAKWLYWDADFTFSDARSVEEDEGQDFIPLAPRITTTTGLAVRHNALAGSLRARYLQDRPANEDNSVVARGYTVFDTNVTYKYRAVTFGLFIENLFNVDWDETQFDTESRIRLADGSLEPAPISEIHFTPGTPLNIKGSIRYEF